MDEIATEGQFGGERSMRPVALRSVQPYRSQDEYVVVMKEDLAEWLNELYDTTMTADDLFDKLETGILLCRYACIVDDVLRKSRDIQSEPVVYRERGVEPGSFQARVNVSAFLAWCRRRPLQMPDDVLFETGDLICQPQAERNERQVALGLLEVGRRSAALRVGLPAPQLVRLEAEIDAEIRADDTTTTDDVSDHDDEESPSNTAPSPVARASRSAATKTRSIPAPRITVSRDTGEPAVSSDTIQSEKRGSAWQRRRFRPIIPVDMMSLDEMVREILSRCTCPNQYPMIRVSEGKYRIGDNLTLIFVRILRQHVMVRIGGGWNTLDNYLARCDPCRCQKTSPSSAVSQTAASTFSYAQWATSGGDSVSERRRQLVDRDRLNSSNSDLPSPSSPSMSAAAMTSAAVTTSGRLPRRRSDLSLTSEALPVGSANCQSPNRRSPAKSTQNAESVAMETDDVMLDSATAEGCSCFRDNVSTATYQGLVCPTSTAGGSDQHRQTLLPSTPSLPLLTTSASATSTPVRRASCSCTRLMASDDVRRMAASRPSRIPVPLRLAAQCRSHGTGLFSDVAASRQRHGRCDSGVDLNLSSPDD